MKHTRPAPEVSYVSDSSRNQLDYLKNNPKAQNDYLLFIQEKTGVDPAKMLQRLRMTWGGRAPTSLMISSCSEYFATGRHLGCVLEKSAGRTFVAPKQEMATLQDTILTLACLPRITSAKLARGLVGWTLEVCFMGPPPDSENLSFPESSKFWDAFWSKKEFARFPKFYRLTSGEKAMVVNRWSQEYSILEIREEANDPLHDDWDFYLNRALTFIDYAFHRSGSKYLAPGFREDNLRRIQKLLMLHKNNPAAALDEEWNSATLDLASYLFYFEQDLSTALRKQLLAVFDSLAVEASSLRSSYLEDQAYACTENIDHLDSSRRQEYFYLGNKVEEKLRAIACANADELLKLHEKAIASLPPLQPGEEWKTGFADRSLGLTSEEISYLDQITPLRLSELRAVVEAYDSPDLMGVLCLLEQMVEGDAPSRATPKSELSSRVWFSFPSLVLFGSVFSINIRSAGSDYVEAVFSSGKNEIKLSLKSTEIDEYHLYLAGKKSDNAGVRGAMNRKLNTLGALLSHLRKIGKISPLPKTKKSAAKK